HTRCLSDWSSDVCSSDLGARGVEPDFFFYDQAARVIERERKTGPLFVFTYLAANHFPWDHTFRPDLTPDWRNLGNAPHIEEYLRSEERRVGKGCSNRCGR